MAEGAKPTGFFSTLPGVLTAATGLIGAITALLAGLGQAGLIGEKKGEPPAASAQSEPAPSQAKLAAQPASQANLAAQPASQANLAAQPDAPPPSTDYVTRIALKGDARTYYVTRQNQVVGAAPGGAVTLVGQRSRGSGSYLWSIRIDGRPYAIDRTGRVWSTPEGAESSFAGRAQKIDAKP